jgi:energy-coupling factor transport system ATP-binding protein
MAMFNDLHQKEGKSIVMITHDMDLVAQYAKRVIVLNKGEIVFDGKKEELFMHPKFNEFHLDYPSPMKLLNHLRTKFDLPFKLVLNEKELLDVLKGGLV